MRPAVVYAFMVLHVLCAAGTYVLGKPAAVGFADPAALTLARALGAAVLVLAFSGTLIPLPRFSRMEWLEVALLGVLLVPLNQYSFLRGLKDTVPSHPPLIFALTPVGVLLLTSVLARRAPPRIRSVGVLMALAGVVVLFRPWVDAPEFAQLRRGDLWILVGLSVWVVYTVAVRRLARRHDPRTVTAWCLVFGTLALAPFAAPALLQTDFAAISTRAWVGLVWLSVVTSTVMMLLWNTMLRHLEAVQVAICANAQPVATALLAALLASAGYLQSDQDLGPVYWIGTLLVLVGVWLVQRTRPPSC